MQKILDAKNAKKVEEKKVENAAPKKSATRAAPVYKDPYIEQEEMELARLSKLLGIEKGIIRCAVLIFSHILVTCKVIA